MEQKSNHVTEPIQDAHLCDKNIPKDENEFHFQEAITYWNEKFDILNAQFSSFSNISSAILQIDTKLNTCIELYSKLSEMYHLMTEYKKKNSLITMKLCSEYEQLLKLKLFCEDKFSGTDDVVLILKKRVDNMESHLKKVLNSFGIIPIYPEHNAEYNPDEHEIESVVDSESETDISGRISECLKMGILKDNVVIQAAKVSIFKNKDQKNN